MNTSVRPIASCLCPCCGRELLIGQLRLKTGSEEEESGSHRSWIGLNLEVKLGMRLGHYRDVVDSAVRSFGGLFLP